MLITHEQIYGWRGRRLSGSLYTMANITDFVKAHPGSNRHEIYAGINNGDLPTDIEERKRGLRLTGDVLTKLRKSGRLRGIRAKDERCLRYWVSEDE